MAIEKQTTDSIPIVALKVYVIIFTIHPNLASVQWSSRLSTITPSLEYI